MKAIICGGGTVGHITPGISIAEVILKKEPKSEILFVGRVNGEENDVVKKRGFTQRFIEVTAIKRSLNLKNVKALGLLINALKDAKKILKEESPDVVIGTGGYVCWPVIRAAQKLKIPTLIHESNLTVGVAARNLSKRCDRVLLNFKESEKEFSRRDNLTVVGNPLPDAFYNLKREDARATLKLKNTDIFILSLGGSGGAETINKSAMSLMESYCQKNASIKHLHATGKKYFKEMKEKYPEYARGKNGCRITPFIDDMALYMKAADIIISLCGAMTLSEICAAECIPILIPSPNVTNDHQYKNAKAFLDKGAAIMIEERELNDAVLTDAVKYLERSPAIRKNMRKNLKEFKTEGAKEKIYRAVKEVIK